MKRPQTLHRLTFFETLRSTISTILLHFCSTGAKPLVKRYGSLLTHPSAVEQAVLCQSKDRSSLAHPGTGALHLVLHGFDEYRIRGTDVILLCSTHGSIIRDVKQGEALWYR